MNENVKYIFRKTMSYMPPVIRKAITKRKVDQCMEYLMSKDEVRRCCKDLDERETIVERYKNKYPQQAALIKTQMNEMFPKYRAYQEMTSEQKEELRRDAEFCWFAYGFIIHEYVFLDLFGVNRDPERRKKLVSDAERVAFRFSANDFSDTVYSDKVSAYEKLKPYYKRDIVAVRGKNDLPALKDFIAKHPAFVEKVARSSRGAGVNLIDLNRGGGYKSILTQLLPRDYYFSKS